MRLSRGLESIVAMALCIGCAAPVVPEGREVSPSDERSYPLVVGPARAWPMSSPNQRWRFEPQGRFMAVQSETCAVWDLDSGLALGQPSSWPDGEDPCASWPEGRVIPWLESGLVASIDLHEVSNRDGSMRARFDRLGRNVEIFGHDDQRLHVLPLGEERVWGPIADVFLVWGSEALAAIVELECRDPACEPLVLSDDGEPIPSYRILRWQDFAAEPETRTVNWDWLHTVNSESRGRWDFEWPEAVIVDPEFRRVILPIRRETSDNEQSMRWQGGRISTIELGGESSRLDYEWSELEVIRNTEADTWSRNNRTARISVTNMSPSGDGQDVRVEAQLLQLWPEPVRLDRVLFEAESWWSRFDVRVLDSSEGMALAWRACWHEEDRPASLALDADGCLGEFVLTDECVAHAAAAGRLLVECGDEWRLRSAEGSERLLVRASGGERIQWQWSSAGMILVGSESGTKIFDLEGSERRSLTATELLDCRMGPELGRATVHAEGQVSVVDLDDGSDRTIAVRARPEHVALAPDGTRLAVAVGDLVEVFELETARLVGTWRAKDIEALGWRQDGEVLFTQAPGLRRLAWNPRTGTRVPEADAPTGAEPSWRWSVDVERGIVSRFSDGMEVHWRDKGALAGNGLLDGDAEAFSDFTLRAPERLDLGAFAPLELAATIHQPGLLKAFFAGVPLPGPRVTASGRVVAPEPVSVIPRSTHP